MLPVAAIVLLLAGLAHSQTMYKYRGDNDEWIYTDRKPPSEQKVEIRSLESSFVEPEFSIGHNVYGKTIEFTAHNEFHAPIEVRLEFTEIAGVSYPDPDQILRFVINPRSDQLLLTLDVLESVDIPNVEYLFEYMAGDPTAVHQPDTNYRIPFSLGQYFPITQAYPDTMTHKTIDSMHAVDIAMPIGTDILAARDGVVFDIAADNFRGGLNLSRDGQAANIVRILHDDGTFSLYAHLNWNSIRGSSRTIYCRFREHRVFQRTAPAFCGAKERRPVRAVFTGRLQGCEFSTRSSCLGQCADGLKLTRLARVFQTMPVGAFFTFP